MLDITDINALTFQENPGTALLSLDFRKAFDTIEWNYLNTALQTFSFDPDILNWFYVIYHQVSSYVNGHASDFFSFEQGVRPGCPLSGALFLVVEIEFLPQHLKKTLPLKALKSVKRILK